MRCTMHFDVPAAGMCTHDGKPYCADCLMEVEGRNVAKHNVSALIQSVRATASPQLAVMRTPKSRTTAMLMALFLGGLGGHHFYLGNAGLGLFYLLFSWTFLPLIFSIAELVGFSLMSEEKFHAKYG